MILACKNICKTFITDSILENVSFHINEGEKVALVGINGAGKSTLFKIIMGQLLPDSGEIISNSQTEIGYLAQNSSISSDHTVYEEILSAKAEIIEMEKQLEHLQLQMAKHHNEPQLFDSISKKYTDLSHQFEMLDGYSYKSRVKGVLIGLGFKESEFDKLSSNLSGGQKTRLALARILISNPDLLLLDEPTNHLDIQATEWLENYLSAYNGSLFIISHDRYFLDKIVSKVIEIENTKCTVYNGNYTFYSHNKEITKSIEEKHYVNQQKLIKQQEEVIKQLKSFNREKSIKRARSREKSLEKIERLDKPVTLNDSMKFDLKPRITSGQDVLHLENLSKSFSGQQIFSNINFEIKKGEKIALIGDNGTGKSTILKILTNQLKADTGVIQLGSKVNIGYYDQEHTLLDQSKNLIEEISDAYPTMKTGDIRDLLAKFLFFNDDVFKQVGQLSGGEKGRLTLAKLMLSKANLLLLDEPTNHLDMVSKEILEQALASYTGTLLFVSHDRYFINQVATRILELKKDGVNSFIGNYDYYLEKRNVTIAIDESKPTETTTKSNKEVWLQKKEESAKQRKKEKQIQDIEKKIHTIENEIQQIDDMLCLEEIFTNHFKANELSNEKDSLESDLLELYANWEELQT